MKSLPSAKLSQLHNMFQQKGTGQNIISIPAAGPWNDYAYAVDALHQKW